MRRPTGASSHVGPGGRRYNHYHRHSNSSSFLDVHGTRARSLHNRRGFVARADRACASRKQALDDRLGWSAAINSRCSRVESGFPRTSRCELRNLCPVLGMADAHHNVSRNPPSLDEDQEVWPRTRLEAPLATLSSSRFYDLVERIFAPRRQSGHVIFDICKVEYPAVRQLAENSVPSCEAIDQTWLQRAELCGHDAVVRFLCESQGARPKSILALFVDERCGLIASHEIDTSANFEVPVAISEILGAASYHHARGVILTSHESDRVLAGDERREKLTLELDRKGAAIDVFLLDHFVFTNGAWKRMLVVRETGQP